MKILWYIIIAFIAIVLTYFFWPQRTIYKDSPVDQEEILSDAIDHQNFLIMAQRQYIESIQQDKQSSIQELQSLGGVKERHTNPDKFWAVECDFQPGLSIEDACTKVAILDDLRKLTLEWRKEIAQEKEAIQQQATWATISE